MALAGELERLRALRDDGTLSEAEFEAAKARLLDGDGERPSKAGRGGAGISRALWALVIVVFLGAAGVIALMAEATDTIRIAAGAAAMVAGTLGAVLGAVEDLSVLVIGALALSALAIAAIAFSGAAPVLVLAVLAVLAVGAVVSWFADMV